MKKLLKRTIIFLAFICIGLYLILTYSAPYAIIKPYKAGLDISPSDFGLEFEHHEIVSYNNDTLRGYHIKSLKENPQCVMILIHGIGGCKEHFLNVSANLANIGVESMLFDLRAHGTSGGEYCSYGFHEKKDISNLVDYVKSQHPDLPIGIWGNSLGGAIALQSMAHDDRIGFGVIESTFSELDVIVSEYGKRFTGGLLPKWMTDYVLSKAGEIAEFNPDEVKPKNASSAITNPVLIAHGDNDQRIDIKYGKINYDHLQSKEKQWVEVEGGSHTNLHSIGGEDYTSKILGFIYTNCHEQINEPSLSQNSTVSH